MYETFEDLYGRKSSIEELASRISRYERSSLLWVCSEIVGRLQLWTRPALQNRQNYLAYLADLFPAVVSFRLLRGCLSVLPFRMVFHRRQIGLIAKLALIHCNGYIDARLHRQQLGCLFLMANDQFHHGLLQANPAPDGELRDFYLRMVTEMLAVHEGASPDIASMLTRGHLMLTRYAPQLSNSADFVDVAGLFQAKTSISVSELEALVFATHSRFGRQFSFSVVARPALLPLKRQDFDNTAVTGDKVDSFLRFVTATPNEIAAEVTKSDNGANDVTPFRKNPLVEYIPPDASEMGTGGYLMIDNVSFLERATSGPYWTANETHSKHLGSFWGAVFEQYVNELLTRAASGTVASYFPDPRSDSDSSIQICDGLLLADDSIVLIESKGNIFRADNKYRGDRARLLNEIETKWVRNRQKGSKKGVEQLAAALQILFGAGSPEKVFSAIDWGKVKSVYLCLVTLDPLGGTLGMSSLLNTFLAEGLDPSKYSTRSISQLHCLDIASLERATALFSSMTLPAILKKWSQDSPDLRVPLSMIDLGPSVLNPWLQSEWESVAREIVPIIYPEQDMDDFLKGAKDRFEQSIQ